MTYSMYTVKFAPDSVPELLADSTSPLVLSAAGNV